MLFYIRIVDYWEFGSLFIVGSNFISLDFFFFFISPTCTNCDCKWFHSFLLCHISLFHCHRHIFFHSKLSKKFSVIDYFITFYVTNIFNCLKNKVYIKSNWNVNFNLSYLLLTKNWILYSISKLCFLELKLSDFKLRKYF